MKKLLSLFFSIIAYVSIACGQMNYLDSVRIQRDTINQHFSDTATSILAEEERLLFTGLSFYPANDRFRIPAKFRRKLFKTHFEMPTSTSRKPLYRKYGVLKFSLDDEKFRLVLYQNVEYSKYEGHEDELFCPFKDLTNGQETYGGGRFLDFNIKDLKAHPVIDFNFCYNPYCAYNYKYSCPIPPRENHLKVKINAGVKTFEHRVK